MGHGDDVGDEQPAISISISRLPVAFRRLICSVQKSNYLLILTDEGARNGRVQSHCLYHPITNDRSSTDDNLWKSLLIINLF